MSDLYGNINHLNKTLQAYNLNPVKVKSKITSFRNKLDLYEQNFKKKIVFIVCKFRKLILTV